MVICDLLSVAFSGHTHLFLKIIRIIFSLKICVLKPDRMKTGPEVIKHFSYSSQLSTKFILFINAKLQISVGILTILLA